MQEKSPDVLQHTGLSRKLSVRSYLMLQHRITKIIRFGDRYDFTFRLVPRFYFPNNLGDMQVQS
jgi:hypothetical protein